MGNLAYTYADILDLVAKDFGLNIEKTEKQNKNAIRKKSNGHGKLGIFTASHVRN